jgi:hypothetical protein
MITAAEPPSPRARAFGLSIAFHSCVLAILAAYVPIWHAELATHGFREDPAACRAACGAVFTIRIERRARTASTTGIRRAAETLLPANEPKARSVPAHPPQALSAERALVGRSRAPQYETTRAAAVASGGSGGRDENVSLATPPANLTPVASRLQPREVSANPSGGVQSPPPQPQHTVSEMLGPANWGSGFDAPTLRDRVLYEELVATLPEHASVTIAVDDRGRARSVEIEAPGLDAATIEELRRRLLVASYAPVERDGIAFDGTLRIIK